MELISQSHQTSLFSEVVSSADCETGDQRSPPRNIEGEKEGTKEREFWKKLIRRTNICQTVSSVLERCFKQTLPWSLIRRQTLLKQVKRFHERGCILWKLGNIRELFYSKRCDLLWKCSVLKPAVGFTFVVVQGIQRLPTPVAARGIPVPFGNPNEQMLRLSIFEVNCIELRGCWFNFVCEL